MSPVAVPARVPEFLVRLVSAASTELRVLVYAGFLEIFPGVLCGAGLKFRAPWLFDAQIDVCRARCVFL